MNVLKTILSKGADTMSRTFEHFPDGIECIVCHTSEDKPCVLIAMDGTADGNIEEAKPVHVDCAIAERCVESNGSFLMYKKLSH